MKGTLTFINISIQEPAFSLNSPRLLKFYFLIETLSSMDKKKDFDSVILVTITNQVQDFPWSNPNYVIITEVDDVALRAITEKVLETFMSYDENAREWAYGRLSRDLSKTDSGCIDLGINPIEMITVETKRVKINEGINEFVDAENSELPDRNTVKRDDNVYLCVDCDYHLGIFTLRVDDDEDLCRPMRVY